MESRIRPYATTDAPDVVALSLRAWAPVFDSERTVMEIFERSTAKIGDVVSTKTSRIPWRTTA